MCGSGPSPPQPPSASAHTPPQSRPCAYHSGCPLRAVPVPLSPPFQPCASFLRVGTTCQWHCPFPVPSCPPSELHPGPAEVCGGARLFLGERSAGPETHGHHPSSCPMRPAPRHPVTQHLHPTPVSLAPDPKAQGSRPLPGRRGQNTHTWQGWSGSPGEQVPVKGQAPMHTEELGPLPAALEPLPRPGQQQRQRVTRQVPQRWRHRQGCPHAPSGEVLEPTDQGERGQQARAPAGSASSVAAPAASSPSPHAGPSRKTGQQVGGGPRSLGRVLTLRHACLPSMEGVTSSEPRGGRNAVGRSGGTWCRRHPRLSRWRQRI